MVNLFTSFINGLPHKTEAVSGSNISNNKPLYIGFKGSESNPCYFHGIIDDIRIYDRALSADEVSLLYRVESPNHFVDSAKDLEMIWVEPALLPWGRPSNKC